MYAGIVSHYYPIPESPKPTEKGIDVWLALEAYDLAVHKRFDVLVLFTGDQDFVPLVRKVNSIGTQVMLIGMDNVQFVDEFGKSRYINTAQRLIEEASFPTLLNREIEDRRADRLIDGLFQR